MSDRRELITAGAAAIPELMLGPCTDAAPGALSDPAFGDCARHARGTQAGYFPNAVVTTHDHRKALFYDDLIRGKTVMIHFMSLADEKIGALVEHLGAVTRTLGDRMGREVFLYSITVDPVRDTPRALHAFARQHRIGPGWSLVTGEPEVIALVRDRLFVPGLEHRHHDHHDPDGEQPRDCSLGLIRYGNAAAGLWGSVPTRTDPLWIAQRLEWVRPRPRPAGPPRRRGPVPPRA